MRPDKLPWRNEKHLYQQAAYFELYNAVALPPATAEAAMTYEELQAAERDIIEFRPWKDDWKHSLVRPIARRLLGPPPQEAKVIASAGAWQREMQALPPREAQRVEDEAVRRFAGAVILQHPSARRNG
jgi:hypothetical protein